MKRDFKEEYQNYIETDMPDLWSRIEPNLSPKQSVNNEQSRPQTRHRTEKKRFLKTAIPAAAALCVLVIGIKVIRMQENLKSGTTATTEMIEETAAEEMDDADELTAETAEETAGEAVEEAAEEEAEYEDTNSVQLAASGEAAEDTSDGVTADKEAESAPKPLEIAKAVLSRISVASEEMQEKGYAYVYTFRLEDESMLLVYVTNAQCESMEENGLEVARQEAYSLIVCPISGSTKQESQKEGEYFLQEIEKLP